MTWLQGGMKTQENMEIKISEVPFEFCRECAALRKNSRTDRQWCGGRALRRTVCPRPRIAGAGEGKKRKIRRTNYAGRD